MTPGNPSEGGPGKARRRPLWRDPKRLWHERRVLVILLLAGVVALAAGALVAYELLKRPADVHNIHVTFKPQKPKKLEAKTVNWPIFGLNRARTRYLPAKGVKPPYRLLWHFTDRPLLEFPPVYDGGKLYFVNNNGTAFALNAKPARSSGNETSGALTPPLRRTTNTASTSSTSCRATSSSSMPRRGGSSGNAGSPVGRSPRRGDRQHASTSAARTGSSSPSAPAMATCAGRPRWGGR